MGKFEIKKDKARKFPFNLKATNGQVILISEVYEAKNSCNNGIESFSTHFQFDNRCDRKASINGEPYFNLVAANGHWSQCNAFKYCSNGKRHCLG